MTGKLVEVERNDPPKISRLGFVGALFGAPVVGAVVALPLAALLTNSFPFGAMVSMFSVIIGGPLYLIVGTPVLSYAVHRGWRGPLIFAALAFFTNLVAWVAFVPLAVMFGSSFSQSADMALVIGGFGSVFAPLWGALFSVLYGLTTPKRNQWGGARACWLNPLSLSILCRTAKLASWIRWRSASP